MYSEWQLLRSSHLLFKGSYFSLRLSVIIFPHQFYYAINETDHSLVNPVSLIDNLFTDIRLYLSHLMSWPAWIPDEPMITRANTIPCFSVSDEKNPCTAFCLFSQLQHLIQHIHGFIISWCVESGVFFLKTENTKLQCRGPRTETENISLMRTPIQDAWGTTGHVLAQFGLGEPCQDFNHSVNTTVQFNETP